MSENVKRLNVTLPLAHIERIKRVMTNDPARYPSMSTFVADAVAERLSEAEAHRALLNVLQERGGEPTDKDRQWAEYALHTATLAAQDRQARKQYAA